MSHEHASPEPETVAEQQTGGGRRPSACCRLADCLESPPPYRKHVTKERLWLVLDAHGDSVLWSGQEIAVDAAVEALNACTKGMICGTCEVAAMGANSMQCLRADCPGKFPDNAKEHTTPRNEV